MKFVISDLNLRTSFSTGLATILAGD